MQIYADFNIQSHKKANHSFSQKKYIYFLIDIANLHRFIHTEKNFNTNVVINIWKQINMAKSLNKCAAMGAFP